MNTGSQWSKQEACFHVQIRWGCLSITTTVSLLAKGFDVLSVLHGKVSLVADNHIYSSTTLSKVRSSNTIYLISELQNTESNKSMGIEVKSFANLRFD